MKKSRIVNIIIGAALVASIGLNIYQAFYDGSSDSMIEYLGSSEQIDITYSGILKSHEKFRDGGNAVISYDFEHEDYKILLEKYNIAEIAGNGSEYEKALRLMNEFAPRLSHFGNFDYSVDIEALPLLEYSLDKPENGINCRCKAQILNEMLLSLGIYSRKLWIMPNSKYDGECHVVNEVWDTTLGKWVMVDISNNIYWVDKEGKPLSVLEIRQLAVNREFSTPVYADDDLSDLENSLNKAYSTYLYYLKNLDHMEYGAVMTVGESEDFYYLIPENKNVTNEMVLISENNVVDTPIK